ncbi:MAG: T9SS type A sorting domain-containing protein, partial [Bacteroidales bacterium]|nr:T9SS type A sorting domain-containing protein [Bacteroidales bacterium]
CAKSSSIDDYGTTSMAITIEVGQASNISFYYKVSSEGNYDKLHFYIDDTEKGNWSGEVAWSHILYPITAGTHTLKWEYTKHVYLSSCDDCACIDNVVFPALTVITDVKEEVVRNTAIYPNPSQGNFTIDLGEETSTVTIFNSVGQVVYQESGLSGTKTMNLGLTSGIYFVNIRSDKANSTQKLIVK